MIPIDLGCQLRKFPQIRASQQLAIKISQQVVLGLEVIERRDYELYLKEVLAKMIEQRILLPKKSDLLFDALPSRDTLIEYLEC